MSVNPQAVRVELERLNTESRDVTDMSRGLVEWFEAQETPTLTRRERVRVVLRNRGVLVAVRDEWADELIRALVEAAR